MSWKQDITPNVNDQVLVVYNSGKVLPDWFGMCLAVTESSLGVPRLYDYATQAYNATKVRHANQDLPEGVWVPIWYSWTGTISGITRDWGHVALARKLNSVITIKSAPYSHKPYFDTFTNDFNLGGHYKGLKYLGWTEDMCGKTIVHQVADPAPTPAPAKMPPVGSSIQLIPTQERTTYRPGTTTVAGHINAVNSNFVYLVRGYDSKYPYRIIINTASGGGNGVALALYYTNGTNIGGWKQV